MLEAPSHNGNKSNIEALDRKINGGSKNPEWADDLTDSSRKLQGEGDDEVKKALSDINNFEEGKLPDFSDMEAPEADVPDKQIRHNGNAVDVGNLEE